VNDPTGRTLRLLSLLQTHRFWPGGELAGRLGVSARTLRRDIDRLRELGYPVDATPGVAGGYRLAAGSHVPPLMLDDEEAVALAVGLRAAAGASIGGIEDTALQALAKLEQVLPDRLRRRVRTVHAQVVPLRWGGTGPTVDPEALAVLAQGCRDSEQVRFDYRRRDGEETRRLVEPHKLVSAGRRWYLVAWDVRRADWRSFRVDRLTGASLAGVRFRPRRLPAGDAAEFVARSISSMPMAYEATVVADGPVGEVRDLLRWTDAQFEEFGGACRIHLRGDSIEGLAIVIAVVAVRFDVEVDGPTEVVARLKEVSRRLRAVPVSRSRARPG
jgi:predicted DNA-binding transcriptional regulator YafY